MSTNFTQLKNNRKSNFDKLNDELKKAVSGGERQEDPRFWYPQRDKAGNGYAVIRFLPAPANEDVPFVRIFSHGFKNPVNNKWLFENCPTTLGNDCPVCENNSSLWNSGIESDKDIVRKRKRQLKFVSNIYVIEDPATPENVGKVFLFNYGKKIFDKLYSASNPEFPDEKPIDPFDFWEGANFRFKIRKIDGQTNYDKSEFDSSKALSEDEDVLKEIWEKEYSLQEFVDPKLFKSYDELKTKLYTVLGAAAGSVVNEPVQAPKEEKSVESPVLEETSAPSNEDEDDIEAMFNKLADDDEPF